MRVNCIYIYIYIYIFFFFFFFFFFFSRKYRVWHFSALDKVLSNWVFWAIFTDLFLDILGSFY